MLLMGLSRKRANVKRKLARAFPLFWFSGLKVPQNRIESTARSKKTPLFSVKKAGKSPDEAKTL
jgi:hypothetical protein